MTKKKQTTDPLNDAISRLNDTYGKGTVMQLGDVPIQDVPSISTGSIRLDMALGIGGYPRGRVVEAFGIESVGKSSFALHAIANVQKKGEKAVMVDAEHALDREYAKKLDVDVDKLILSQPDNGEQALEVTDHLIRSGGVGIVVVDSVAALTPKTELEGEMGESKMGVQARLMSQAMRKLTTNVHKTNTTLMFINQLRDKIGVMFGSPSVTTGGNALKYYSSVRVEIKRIGQVKAGEEVIGHTVRANVVKNKLAPPFKKAEFDIIYGEGISRSSEIIDLGVETGVVEKSGSWFSYGDTKLGQGKEKTRSLLNDNPDLMDEIEKKIKTKLA
jgi:recombination protein RecA